VNTPHPDLETLAELADPDSAASAALADPEAAAVLEHVAGCETCTADLEALRHVRATLRALPPVPMPPDVAERIDAALRAASTPTGNIVPLQKRSRAGSQPWWRTMPYGAAASVVVILALAAAGIVGIMHAGSGSKGSVKSAAAPAATTAAGVGSATVESGTNYTADDLRSQVAAVVNSNVPGAAADFPGLTQFGTSASAAAAAPAPAASSAPAAVEAAPSTAAPTFAAAASSPAFAAPAAGTTGGTARGPLQNAAAITAPGGPLADPAVLAACVQTLAGKPEQPVLVDFATFNGAASTIIVLPDPDIARKLDIYVEADTANCANQEITFAAFLPPGG
jgi:negative regulator of sigma E activity